MWWQRRERAVTHRFIQMAGRQPAPTPLQSKAVVGRVRSEAIMSRFPFYFEPRAIEAAPPSQTYSNFNL